MLRTDASLWVCWFWSYLGETPVQAKVNLCLLLSQGYLVGAIKLFMVDCCLYWTWRHTREAMW